MTKEDLKEKFDALEETIVSLIHEFSENTNTDIYAMSIIKDGEEYCVMSGYDILE